MSGELTRWIASTPTDREHARALDRLDDATDLAFARINSIVGVAQGAMVGVMSIELFKQTAELASPGGAERYDLLALDALTEIRSTLRGLGGRLR